VEVVRASPTDLALDDWEAVLLQGLLSVLQFLELDEDEVKVLEQRSAHTLSKLGTKSLTF